MASQSQVGKQGGNSSELHWMTFSSTLDQNYHDTHANEPAYPWIYQFIEDALPACYAFPLPIFRFTFRKRQSKTLHSHFLCLLRSIIAQATQTIKHCCRIANIDHLMEDQGVPAQGVPAHHIDWLFGESRIISLLYVVVSLLSILPILVFIIVCEVLFRAFTEKILGWVTW